MYRRETPVANLFTTMLERVGVRPEHVSDSTGRLAGLSLPWRTCTSPASARVGEVYLTAVSRPDSALALALLYGLQGKREALVGGLSRSAARA